MMLTKRNHTKQPYSSIFMSMETIQNDRHETFEGAVHEESRDDHTIPSLMDEDLVIAHPSAADHEIRDEAIEIINISFLHE